MSPRCFTLFRRTGGLLIEPELPKLSDQLRTQFSLPQGRVSKQHLLNDYVPLRLRHLFLHIGDPHLKLKNTGKRRGELLFEWRIRRIDIVEFLLKELRDCRLAWNMVGEFDYRAHL